MVNGEVQIKFTIDILNMYLVCMLQYKFTLNIWFIYVPYKCK